MDLLSGTEVTEAVFISQLWSFGALVREFLFAVRVIILVVLYTIGVSRRGCIFPVVTGIQVVDPVFDCTNSACDDLSHCDFAWSQRVAGRVGVEHVLHEVAS